MRVMPAVRSSLSRYPISFARAEFHELDPLERCLDTALDLAVADDKAALIVPRDQHDAFVQPGVELGRLISK